MKTKSALLNEVSVLTKQLKTREKLFDDLQVKLSAWASEMGQTGYEVTLEYVKILAALQVRKALGRAWMDASTNATIGANLLFLSDPAGSKALVDFAAYCRTQAVSFKG